MFSEVTRAAMIALACADPFATRTDKDRLQCLIDCDVNLAIVAYDKAAKMLGVSKRTVQNLVSAGKLTAVDSGGAKSLGVTMHSIVEFINPSNGRK